MQFLLQKEHAALEKGKGYVVTIMHTLLERIFLNLTCSRYNYKYCRFFNGVSHTHIIDVPRETSHKTCVHFRFNNNIKTIVLLYSLEFLFMLKKYEIFISVVLFGICSKKAGKHVYLCTLYVYIHVI